MSEIAYVFKYALTEGILSIPLKSDSISDNGYLIKDGFGVLFSSKEYSLSLAEAKEKAEAMRLKKIKSLQKQIQKLEQMNFDNAEVKEFK